MDFNNYFIIFKYNIVTQGGDIVKKKIILIVITALLIVVLLCAQMLLKEDYSNVNVEISEIMNTISQTLNKAFPTMIELDDSNLNSTYGIEPETLEEYIIKVPIINIRADEIAIVKVKDIKYVKDIENKFRERANTIQHTFEDYLDEQYVLTKNPLIISKGKYVLMSVSEKNEIIEEIFNSYFVTDNIDKNI